MPPVAAVRRTGWLALGSFDRTIRLGWAPATCRRSRNGLMYVLAWFVSGGLAVVLRLVVSVADTQRSPLNSGFATLDDSAG